MGSMPQFQLNEQGTGDSRLNFNPNVNSNSDRHPVQTSTMDELNAQFRHMLQAEIQENCKLRRCIDSQKEQIKALKKSNQDLEGKMNSEPALNAQSQSPIAAAKIVELKKKKNRDMTAKIKSMKTKMQSLLNENSGLKQRVQELEEAATTATGHGSASPQQSSTTLKSSKSREELQVLNQQLTQTTSKMMEYRRQCQQLRIDLRAALRALSQEIGDGVSTNPKSVHSIVTNPSWRGRQQQILTLTQKVNELQAKLAIFAEQHQEQKQKHQKSGADSRSSKSKDTVPAFEDDEDDDSVAMDRTYSIHDEKPRLGGGGAGDGEYDYSREIQLEKRNRQQGPQPQALLQQSTSHKSTSAIFNASHRHLMELQIHDKKKHEQMDKLKQEVEDYKMQLQTFKQERKAAKARTATLENQVRSLRCEIEELERKLHEKTEESEDNASEVAALREELAAARNRERQLREGASKELCEAQQALAREKGVTLQLKEVLQERQDLVQKMDAEIKRLQSNLELCCGSVDLDITSARDHGRGRGVGVGVDIAAKIKQMKAELQHASQVVEEYEKERRDLLAFTHKLIGDVESERESHSATQEKLVKCVTVIDQTNDCLTICLDESQITCKSILGHVESVRSLIREIKTVGDLYSLELVRIDEVQKLKTRIAILSKENKILHQQASKSLVERRRDLAQYGNFATKLRSEFLAVLQAATNVFSRHID